MELGFSGVEGGLLFYKRKEILILFFLFFLKMVLIFIGITLYTSVAYW